MAYREGDGGRGDNKDCTAKRKLELFPLELELELTCFGVRFEHTSTARLTSDMQRRLQNRPKWRLRLHTHAYDTARGRDHARGSPSQAPPVTR